MSAATSSSTVPTIPAELPRTRGALLTSGWQSRPVSEELARNLEARIAEGTSLSIGVKGFDDTVLPQLETAILARLRRG